MNLFINNWCLIFEKKNGIMAIKAKLYKNRWYKFNSYNNAINNEIEQIEIKKLLVNSILNILLIAKDIDMIMVRLNKSWYIQILFIF